MTVLSIQSHVVRGRVGNRSAVFPLERMGIDVWPLNTVQFSSHTGTPGWKGASFGADHVADIVGALDGLGALGSCDAVLSGYVGDADTGRSILGAVRAVKRDNPSALYCCDPVMGDKPAGFYVRPDVPGFMAREACPAADIVIPNLFESEVLAGSVVNNLADAERVTAAIHELGPRVVIITSFSPPGEERTGFYLSDSGKPWTLMTPRLPFASPPKGSGDLFSALFLGNYLKNRDAPSALGKAASSLFAILEASQGSGCLAVVQAQEAIEKPPRLFEAAMAYKARR